MELEQIRYQKRALENNIRRAIAPMVADFQESAGVPVNAISIGLTNVQYNAGSLAKTAITDVEVHSAI